MTIDKLKTKLEEDFGTGVLCPKENKHNCLSNSITPDFEITEEEDAFKVNILLNEREYHIKKGCIRKENHTILATIPKGIDENEIFHVVTDMIIAFIKHEVKEELGIVLGDKTYIRWYEKGWEY